MYKQVLKIGHRGAMGYEPENTLLSFRRAIEMGVDMIELDAHLCKTGELIVIHDESVDRTTNGKGLVADKTLAELKTLDAGKGQTISTLEDLFIVSSFNWEELKKFGLFDNESIFVNLA